MADLEGKLFDNPTKPETPTTNNLPLPYPYPKTPPGSFPFLMLRIHKLSFHTFDGKEDPLPWLNRCEQFFKGQNMPETEEVWYASYHLTGGTQWWYMHLMQYKAVMDWAYFTCCINERFVPPTQRNPLGELASLHKTDTIDDYTEHFLAHVAHTRTLDEQQQVNIYTTGLLEPLKTDVEL